MHDYYFMNNKKHQFIAIAKAKALLAKFLSNHDADRFFQIASAIFKQIKYLQKHEKFCKVHD